MLFGFGLLTGFVLCLGGLLALAFTIWVKAG